MRPAGAVGLVAPTGLIGRIISSRQGIKRSHVVIALGDDRVLDSTWPWTRITPESYWAKHDIIWYAPATPFTPDEERQLKSIAKMIRGRIGYGVLNLIMFLIRGVPGRRSHHMFCSYLAAELYMVLRNYDMSGCEQPYNIDLREILIALQHGPFTRLLV